MRVVLNVLALVVEIALIAGAAYLGALHPIWFAVLTAGLTLLLAAQLEYARLHHELPFYFEGALTRTRLVFARLWSSSEALIKSAAAAFVALLTFSGTDVERLQIIAVLFGACVFLGTTMLTRVFLSWGEKSLRWGYFRLALPLGIAFSAGIYVLTEMKLIRETSVSELVFDATLNLARTPDLANASEFLFRLSQATDQLIAVLLSAVVPVEAIPYIQIVASTNVLPGFVIAVFTVTITRVVFLIQGRPA